MLRKPSLGRTLLAITVIMLMLAVIPLQTVSEAAMTLQCTAWENVNSFQHFFVGFTRSVPDYPGEFWYATSWAPVANYLGFGLKQAPVAKLATDKPRPARTQGEMPRIPWRIAMFYIFYLHSGTVEEADPLNI